MERRDGGETQQRMDQRGDGGAVEDERMSVRAYYDGTTMVLRWYYDGTTTVLQASMQYVVLTTTYYELRTMHCAVDNEEILPW